MRTGESIAQQERTHSPRGKLRRGEEGVGLVETLIAVAILGLALTALLSAVSTGSLATSRTEERVTAENMARSQLEYIKSQPYSTPPASYAVVTPSPGGYGLTAAAESIPDSDTSIEKIVVTVTRNGETLFVAEDYKVDR
jgi:type II secretory pathway pseudopilin PulG